MGSAALGEGPASFATLVVAGASAKSVARYASAADTIGSMQRLLEMHYNAETGEFRDCGLHTEELELVWKETQQGEGLPPKVWHTQSLQPL